MSKEEVILESETDFGFSPEERHEALLWTLIALEQEVLNDDPVV
ncbi:hypothetical protein [Marinobacterium jannaschii]|nr:hypothetical protein [Marinobacterium jannaschii]